MRLVTFLFVFLAASLSAAQTPVPTVASGSNSGLEGLEWNKWDTDHFVVISINRASGSRIRSEAESAREEVLNRWGLKSQAEGKCKLVVVPDDAMLKRLFGISDPRCEVRKSASGSTESAIWIDEERLSLLPSLVAELELSNEGFRTFARRGIPILERSAAEVREKLGAMGDPSLATVLDGPKPDSDAEDLDRNSAMLCLMVRKELGSRAFAAAAISSPRQVHEELGFASLDEMDRTFRRYRAYLLSDLRVTGRVPDEYLGVRR